MWRKNISLYFGLFCLGMAAGDVFSEKGSDYLTGLFIILGSALLTYTSLFKISWYQSKEKEEGE